MKTLVLGVKQGYVLSFNKIRFGKVNKQNIMKQPGVGHDFEQCSVNFGVGVGKILATPTPTQGKTSDSDRLRLRLRSPGTQVKVIFLR